MQTVFYIFIFFNCIMKTVVIFTCIYLHTAYIQNLKEEKMRNFLNIHSCFDQSFFI